MRNKGRMSTAVDPTEQIVVWSYTSGSSNDDNPDRFGLWEQILLPASLKNLVSGELYNGLLNNLNTLEEAEKLDALLTGE